MKILLVQNMLYVPSVGGANTTTRLLLEGLAQRGHECLLIAPASGSYGPRTRADFLRALAVRGIGLSSSTETAHVFHHRGVEIHAVTDATRLSTYFIGQVRRFEPSAIIVPSQDPGQVLLGAAVEQDAARVIYLALAAWDLPFGPECVLPSAAGARLIGRTSGIVTISAFLTSYIQRWGGFDSTVIHFPVYGSAPFPSLGNFENEFVTLVNPCAIKGISIFLALAQRLPGVTFAAVPTWATTAADKNALKQLPNVRLLDPVDNIDEIFARTRIILVPSLNREAFGNIVVEAMLRGIPVLASDTGGLPEAKLGVDYTLPVNAIERFEARFDDRSCPIPVVPAQDISPWAHALQRLLSDRTHYETLSAASRAAALKFVGRLEKDSYDDFLRYLGAHVRSERVAEPAPPANEDAPQPPPELNKISAEKRALLALRALQLKKKTEPSLR